MWPIVNDLMNVWNVNSKRCGSMVNSLTDWVDGVTWKIIVGLIVIVGIGLAVFPALIVLDLVVSFLIPAALVYVAWNNTVAVFGGPTISFVTAVGLFLAVVVLKNINEYWENHGKEI